jgi:hypothetical protein
MAQPGFFWIAADMVVKGDPSAHNGLDRDNFRIARHPPKNYYETAEDSNAVRANGQIKKLLHRVQYHF